MRRKNMILLAIIFIPVLLVIPINILVIFDAQTRINDAKQAVAEDNNAFINMYQEMIEDQLMQIENYMELLTSENEAFLKLSDISFDRNSQQFYDMSNQLISDFKNFVAMSSSAKSIIAYFDASDTYIIRDNFSALEKQSGVVEKIREALDAQENQHFLNVKKNIAYIEINDRAYLAKIYCGETSKCMVTISLDDFLVNMQRNTAGREYQYYFYMPENQVKMAGQQIMTLEYPLPFNEALSDYEYKGGKFYNYAVQVHQMDLYLGGAIKDEALSEKVPGLSKVFLYLSLISCCIGPVISIVFFHMIEKPLKQLNSGMDEVKKGNTEYRVPVGNKRYENEFDELNRNFNVMLDELAKTKFELYQKEIDRQKVQLRYLNQQIRPHFILNALNIIYTYDDDEFPTAKKMVLYLTKYFRYLVNLQSDYVLLWEEMEHTKNYLDIQKVRYPKRFHFFVEWEEELRYAKIPAVVIQTFVENSIKHGFEKGKTMFVFVLAKKKDGHINITIADTGKGFQTEYLERIQRFLKKRKYDEQLGTGIQNVVNRLVLLYDNQFELKIYNAQNGGVYVELDIPLVVAGEAEINDKSTDC